MVEAHHKVVDNIGISFAGAGIGLKWAAEKRAQERAPHGCAWDFRHGNFIVGEDGIRIVLDLGARQSGDPMQDLAGYCVRDVAFWRAATQWADSALARSSLRPIREERAAMTVDPEARAMVGSVRAG